jgi:hypothetical protein
MRPLSFRPDALRTLLLRGKIATLDELKQALGLAASPWKKTPEIIDAIEILLEHDTAGDPITGLKWTRKTTEKIAEVLQQIDIPVSANTVARLLYPMNFSLRVNRKQIATNSSPYRDQQFLAQSKVCLTA